jgi:uncharacterized protein YjlB
MTPDVVTLQSNGWVPNNSRLPVLLYRRALEPVGDLAAGFEALFRKNAWPPQWRNGIYTYHHYHSTSHEVLGVAAGAARVILGGPDGTEIDLAMGDAVVLPAGTGHCLKSESTDFLVVGAYPPGKMFDICRGAPSLEISARIAALDIPASDPIFGPDGPLCRLWHA